MMQSENAQLISCFVNDYCIPTILFKTISKLKLKTIFPMFTQIEHCKLWSCIFQTAPFKRKKVWYNPLCFMPSVSSSVSFCLCLSLFLSILLLYISCIHTYALRIFHSSILIHMYVLKQTYIDLHLPKQVITN